MIFNIKTVKLIFDVNKGTWKIFRFARAQFLSLEPSVMPMGWSMKSSLVNDIDKVFRACLRPFIAAWNLIASHWELVYQQLKTWKTVELTTKNPPYCVRMYEKSPFDLSTGYDLL